MINQSKYEKKKEWWEKPGLGIMYQIEARPGWIWNRNYDKFNASMKDENGNLRFNGPYCKMKKWVEFSKKIGLDYHIFEAKWHDGICYFDTKYTNWKTPEDYCRIFSEESKKAGIPFMFYYSSIFDHNPQFNDIQPLRCCTPSFLCMHRKKKKQIAYFSLIFTLVTDFLFKSKHIRRNFEYEDKNVKYLDEIRFNDFTYNPWSYEKYMIDQLVELIENYKPDGMWMDWIMGKIESSANIIMNFMKSVYPNVILTFNNSLNYHTKWAQYLTSEAHSVKSAWKKGNKYRNKKKPWELVGPAAQDWDNPLPRPDPYEAARIAVIIMASGGKFSFGMGSQMNGELHAKPARHVKIASKWYNQRRMLFTEAVPMKYKGNKVPGIKLKERFIGIIGNILDNDILIHLINLTGARKELIIKFSQKLWKNIEKVVLEPNKEELAYIIKKDKICITIPKEYVDRIDTIVRIRTRM